MLATDDDPFVLFIEELFPSPCPVSLPCILDKSEKIGLSLFVIPYAATAAAIHNTIIIEIIIFDFSKIIPPITYIKDNNIIKFFIFYIYFYLFF